MGFIRAYKNIFFWTKVRYTAFADASAYLHKNPWMCV